MTTYNLTQFASQEEKAIIVRVFEDLIMRQELKDKIEHLSDDDFQLLMKIINEEDSIKN